jgi:hypothetical protein
VFDVDAGEMLINDAYIRDDMSEGPVFDGIRLVIQDFDPPEVDEESSGWIESNTTLETDVVIQTVFIGGKQTTGIPWPADYQIEIFDEVVDTSTSEFGLIPNPVKFRIKNLTDNRFVDFAFIEFSSGDGLISALDNIIIIEPDNNDVPQLAWTVAFSGDEGYIPPVAGDRLLIRVLKPLTGIDVFELQANVTSIAASSAIPDKITLYPNYPNPFNPETIIRYDLSRNTDVQLTVYNILGQEIISLVDRAQNAGQYSVRWNARNAQGLPVASGVYIYRLITERSTSVHKMLLIR